MKATAAGSAQSVTGAQKAEAERGLKIMLGGKFPASWIAVHSEEVLAQALVEYQDWLTRNPPARNPIGWLCTCAYRRALNVRDSERRRPKMDSLDEVFHAPDEKTPTPEQELLDRDRRERLQAALSHLPEKEIKLLALVYFEDNSIREAGRKLGWQKSAADRHHATAMEKLRALVGDDRSLFTPATLGLAAYLAGRGNRLSRLLASILRPGRELVAVGAELTSAATRRLAETARSISPFSDAGGVAAGSGISRAAGVCGAGVVALVCVGAASVVAPGLNGAQRPAPSGRPGPVKGPARSVTSPPAVATPPLSAPQLPTPDSAEKAEPSKVKSAEPPRGERKQARPTAASKASTKQVEGDFGIDGGSGSTSEAAPASAPETTPRPSTPVPSPASPAPEPAEKASSATVRKSFGL